MRRLAALRAAVPAAAAGALAPLLVAGVARGSSALVAPAAAGLSLALLALHRGAGGRLPAPVAGVVRGEVRVLLLAGQALVVVHLLRLDALPPAGSTAVALAVAAWAALGTGHVGLLLVDGRLRLQRAELRNLPGPGGPLPAGSRLLTEDGVALVGSAAVLLPAALLLARLTGSYALVVPAALAAPGVALVVVASGARDVLAVARRPRGGALLRGVHEAVLAHQPALVLYSNGGPDDLHWITPWLRTLERLGRPAVVMLRKPGVIDLVPPTTVPLVCLPEAADVVPFRLPGARVALFVANGPENLRLLRNPDLRSAFIGHGDSDKTSSANPAVKMYDEVWVAGEAGARRYLDADVGVRREQLRVVGRPQVQGVLPAAARPPGDPYTALYAPTWEGAYADPYESSLAHSGRDVVRALLAAGVRVLFRPHPATGRRSAAHAAAERDIALVLEQAGAGHETVCGAGVDLYGLFNRADLLVADVSGVVSDFLASGKPYVVVDGAALPPEEFRRRNPSAAGAYLAGPAAAGLAAALTDARGPDSLAERRRRVRVDLIGPPTDDPVGVFAAAVDALAATARRPAGQPLSVEQ